MKTLKSWKIIDQKSGKLQFVLIARTKYTQKQLNDLIQNGMYCTVIDERSELVHKTFVE